MSTTRPRAESTVIAPIDFADQPAGALVFLTEGHVGVQAFSVDYITVLDGVVRGWLGATTPLVSGILVVAVPVASTWGVMRRSVVVLRTLSESMLKQKTDQEQEKELVKALFGVQPPAPLPPPTVMVTDGPYL